MIWFLLACTLAAGEEAQRLSIAAREDRFRCVARALRLNAINDMLDCPGGSITIETAPPHQVAICTCPPVVTPTPVTP